MLLTEKIEMKWNSKNKTHYEELGYIYSKMKDVFYINVLDLSDGSAVKVDVKCDYCFKDYIVIWNHRIKSFKDSPIKKDACMKCKHLKASETLMLLYGVKNLMQVPQFLQIQRDSCFDHYGYENPFQSEEIKIKIVETNLEKYGETSFTKTNLYLEKRKQTCLEKYGYEDFTQSPKYREMFTGENSPVWKGGINDVRWDRLKPIYKAWRNSVYQRDNYCCQKCKKHSKHLQSHHILNWKDYEENRYEINNGITFCESCHIDFHRKYGKRNNNAEQVIEFLQNR